MARKPAPKTSFDPVRNRGGTLRHGWLGWYVLSLVSVAAMSLLHASAVVAQQLSVDPVRAVKCFEEAHREGVPSDDCLPDMVSAKTIVRSPERVSDAAYRATLDGLEQLAVTSDVFKARIGAVILLASAGSALLEKPDPGTVNRLATVYRQSNDIHVRSLIARVMCCQAEASQAIEVLKSVAQDDRPGDRSSDWPPAHWALTSLETMGPAGRAALQGLYADGSVKNPRARGYLEYISQHSFQEPEHN